MRRTFMRHALASTGLMLAVSAATAAGSSCEPLAAATMKLGSVASHQTTTYQHGGKSEVAMEAVVINGVKWMRVGAGSDWDKVTGNAGKGLEELRKADCRYVRDDSADGEPTAVYEIRHLDGAVGSGVEQMWVSKSSGLPLRIVAGDGNSKSNAMTRFDYKGVKAPAP
ncbi:MAG: hypothetical protein M3Y55_12730 [Pseudomonadota bacterium]|nr:hypothetical protein [Pseudomonadota bacterium]